MANDATNQDGEVIRIGGLPFGPGARIGPYVYERKIGAGGMAWVLLARDPDGRPIALKVLRASRIDTGQLRFRREFRALARINHPNVIGVESYGDLYGHPYIAMEYVEGEDLHQLIRSFRDISLEERWKQCEQILVDLCRALAHIHRRGLVHRDLKPSNILMDSRGRAKLTDFGIVKDLDPARDPNVSNTLVGTWAYASPEQIGGDPLDHRSDLYSLGVILFAMLTGRRPFMAKDMAGYLELHRDHEAPRACSLVRQIPPHLDEICHRLLRKTPRERFQSAQEILFRLERADADSFRTPPPDTFAPPMVGRDKEVAALQDALAALTTNKGGALWILGPVGCGRTQLLQVLEDQALKLGFPFHHIRMRGAEGAFGSLHRLAEDLSRDLGSSVPADLKPALEAVTRDTERLHGDVRYRFYDAMRLALERALESGPRVLAIDDLHRARMPFVDLLAFLTRTLVAGGHPLLIMGTARNDEQNQVVDILRDKATLGLEPRVLELAPLSKGDIEELVTRLLGDAQGTRALAARLQRETEGNPLFVAQFLQSLLHRGIIHRGPGGLALAIDTEEISAGHLEIPPGIRNMLGERLASIPRPQMEILEVLGVSGRETDVDVLLDVLNRNEEEVLAQVDVLVDSGILREHQTGSMMYLDFTHGKFGDIIYRDLAPERRASLHRHLAAIYELRSAGSASAAEVIGEHYRRAGESGKAYQHLTLAARRLHQRSLPAEAWELAERAGAAEELARMDLKPALFTQMKMALSTVRGDILYGKGEWAKASDDLREVISLADQVDAPADRVRARIRLAATESHQGNDEMAQRLATQALAEARRIGDRELVAEALRALAARAWNRGDLETCGRLAAEGLVMAVGPDLAGPRAELLLAQTVVQASLGHIASATAGLTEAEQIFRRLGLKRSRCLALANLAEFHTWQGNLAQAVTLAEEVRALAHEVLYRVAEGVGTRVLGMAQLELGLIDEGQRHLKRALEILGPLKVHGEIIATRYAMGCQEMTAGAYRRAQHHLSVARGLAAQLDPEGYLPLIQATLAQVYFHSGDPFQAERLLTRVLDAASGTPTANPAGAEGGPAPQAKVPLPRQIQSLVVAARTYQEMGRADIARDLALKAWDLARSRGLRLWALDALLILIPLVPMAKDADEQEVREHYVNEAMELGRALLSQLPPHLAGPFRTRLGLLRTPGAP